MSFCHSMTCRTPGITATAPVRWRQLDGAMGVFWEARGEKGAEGYYLSPDPRIVFFFNDVSRHIRMSSEDGAIERRGRPMTRAVYVPAGMPMWTRFAAEHEFSHLDVHVHRDFLLGAIAPHLGRSAALAVLKRPVELQDVAAIEVLASLLAGEVTSPTKHPLYAQGLVTTMAAGLLDMGRSGREAGGAGLSGPEMAALASHLEEQGTRRVTTSEMAGVLGLSETSFAQLFKATTGESPLQWQLRRRVERAQDLLAKTDLSIAEISAQLGFFDQPHLTRVFRQCAGTTPAAWRRAAERSGARQAGATPRGGR
ncbi:helix-turn-helix domain-containing protein [Lutibaculum baratangense]|uniref:Transcriptional regulator, AraC family n=1 Tax=Lutibaculum baratangense AMV1 TaxID=631454 RepID=V4REG0_9HYPH|nr:AraC family transcriptional regulator [Lutibaculum baratangense]ESR24521.1 Transcriptional regulator, AraC family [Lutibaculum baratangense AMV1]